MSKSPFFLLLFSFKFFLIEFSNPEWDYGKTAALISNPERDYEKTAALTSGSYCFETYFNQKLII